MLMAQNLNFVKEKSFSDCLAPSGSKLRYDFFVEESYLIEFDGEQHFGENLGGWNTEEYFQKIQQHDAIKNAYCKEHNIPLIRIPYTKLKTLCIEDILLETSQFIVK